MKLIRVYDSRHPERRRLLATALETNMGVSCHWLLGGAITRHDSREEFDRVYGMHWYIEETSLDTQGEGVADE